eukprot:5599828-Pyramimonas_sp.AAC.1
MRRTLRELERADPKKEAAKTPKQRVAPIKASINFAFKVHQLLRGFNNTCHTLIVDLRTALQQVQDLIALEESAAQLSHAATATGGAGGEAARRPPRTRPLPSPA